MTFEFGLFEQGRAAAYYGRAAATSLAAHNQLGSAPGRLDGVDAQPTTRAGWELTQTSWDTVEVATRSGVSRVDCRGSAGLRALVLDLAVHIPVIRAILFVLTL